MPAFAPAQRFVTEVEQRKLRPAYVFVGDEAFFRRRCREAILQHLVPPDVRDFSLHELDLAETPLGEVLDRARTPSLMAPFQVFFIRGVKALYGRGSHDDDYQAIEDYVSNPDPDALLIFVADHISIPADVRRMELTDRDRYERIRETLGRCCGIVELARVEEGEGARWIIEFAASRGVKVEPEAARELVDSLGADLMLISSELEKLMRHLQRPLQLPRTRRPAGPLRVRANMTRAQYEDRVERSKEYIRAGDVFQVVMSQRLEVPLRVPPF